MARRDAIEQAVERRRNAMKALDDAITELQVAQRLLDDLTIGSCPGAFTRPGRVAAGPAGGSLSIPAGPDGRPHDPGAINYDVLDEQGRFR